MKEPCNLTLAIGEMGFDVEGVGYTASVLEGGVGGAVDEAHRAAVGVFVGDEVETIRILGLIYSSYFHPFMRIPEIFSFASSMACKLPRSGIFC